MHCSPGNRLFAILVLTVVAAATALYGQQTPPVRRVPAPTRTSSATKQPVPAASPEAGAKTLQDLLQNRELMTELGHLMQKLQEGVKFPPSRTQSRLLEVLPESTLFYAGIPNYGDAVHQALQILREDLPQDAALRDWLHKNKLDADEPKIEAGMQSFYELSQYLGDEFVISGSLRGKDPSPYFVAEIRKPGLREFLNRFNDEYFKGPAEHLRILAPQELESATEAPGSHLPVVLVREDFVVAGLDLASVRELNRRLTQRGSAFASTSLGRRLEHSYQQGTDTVAGVDLHTLMSLNPQTPTKGLDVLEKTGFGDLSYLVTDTRSSGSNSANEFELKFNGPRRGIASWLAPSRPLGGLDFVPSKAAVAGAIVLKNPVEIFDDLQTIAGDSAFGALPQMERQLNINLRQDILSKLTGEIAFEVQPPPAPEGNNVAHLAQTGSQPSAFKIILRTNDPQGLEQSLARLLEAMQIPVSRHDENGMTFYSMPLPAGGQGSEVNYFFADGYLVIATTHEMASDALAAHRSGNSLAKSGALRSSLPGGKALNASLLVYNNAGAMYGSMMAQLAPEMRALLGNTSSTGTSSPVVIAAFADETTINATTSSNVPGSMMPMIIAAVAIPNLLNSRIAANEASAAALVRTVNTAEVTYVNIYPDRGYAASLAVLGPGATDCAAPDARHACLVDGTLGKPSCTNGQWCERSGYRLSVKAVCTPAGCGSYVVTATPSDPNQGKKSYCSLNDAVVRVHEGVPVAAPLSAAECRTWKPLM